MKKLIIYTILLISIPFLIVNYIKIPDTKLKEIELNYSSNIIVRVKRENGNIDNLLLEEYITGVVAGEMPASFELEALKAQCVASRTYTLRKLNSSKDEEYDVTDTVLNQVYLDESSLKEKWQNNYTLYINKIKTAVNETSMEYLDYNGEIINAMYFSTSNGYTEDSGVIFETSLPYLKSVESSYDEEVASTFNSTTSMSLQEFYEKLNLEYNENLNIEILEKSSTNRVLKLKINGVEFSGKDLYTNLKLRSYDFNITKLGTNVEIATKGYGHGVGMSQYGAQGMAKKGYNYQEILSHYYTGTTLKKIEK